MSLKTTQFTIRAGTVLYPNVLTSGLEMWFDAMGKKDTDTYRDTLLNMDGVTKEPATLKNNLHTGEVGYDEEAGGLKLDGVDDYLHGRLTKPFTSLTTEVFFQLNPERELQTLIQTGVLPYNWLLRYHAGSFELVQNNTVLLATADVRAQLATPGQLALLLTATSAALYLNGNLLGEATFAAVPVGTTDDYLFVGCTYPPCTFLEGTFYSVRLYDRLLTTEELDANRATERERWGLA